MWLLHLMTAGAVLTHIVGIMWVRRLAALQEPPFLYQVYSWSMALVPIVFLAPLIGLGSFVALGAAEATCIFSVPLILGGGFLANAHLLQAERVPQRVSRDTGWALIIGALFPWSTVICFLPW